MSYRFELPHIGEGVVEAEIVQWLVKPGDQVVDGQALLEVMTDKAQVEIAVDRPGVVREIFGAPGDVVPVHQVVAVLGTDGAAAAAAAPAAEAPAAEAPAVEEPAPAAAAAPAPAAAPAAVPPVMTAVVESVTPIAPVAAAAPVAAGPSLVPGLAAQQAALSGSAAKPARAAVRNGKLLATPRMRAEAKRRGVSLEEVVARHGGSAAPVDLAAASVSPALGKTAYLPGPANTLPWSPLPAGEGPEERVKLTGLRKRIAEQMVRSKAAVPHFCYVDEFDLTRLEALRKRLKKKAAAQGAKLTMLPFFMKALVHVFQEFPEVNAWYDNATGEVVIKRHYNIGIACDTPRGLYVVVLRDIDKKSVNEIAIELAEVTTRCREGKATSRDLTGATFTITSVGKFGGMFATPVINQPEVAILGLNRLEERPVVRDGQVVVRTMMYVSPSFDHRVIDGAVAARFVTALKAVMEEPESLLLTL